MEQLEEDAGIMRGYLRIRVVVAQEINWLRISSRQMNKGRIGAQISNMKGYLISVYGCGKMGHTMNQCEGELTLLEVKKNHPMYGP